MSTRTHLPALAVVLAAFFASFPPVCAASELVSYASEVERLSGVLNVPNDSAAEILAAMLAHRQMIRSELTDHDTGDRLKWKEFSPIQAHARTTARTIRSHLNRGATHRTMRELHAQWVPDSIRPRQALGLLFERARPRIDVGRVHRTDPIVYYSPSQPPGQQVPQCPPY